MSSALQSFVKVNQDFRKTSGVISLGKKLFDPNSQTSLNPVYITSVLRQAGVPVPKSVVITADVAQILLSGGAIMSDVEQGASIGQFLSPSFSAMKAGLDILELTGLLSANSPAAQMINFGVDVGMVVATGGLNVLADLSLVLDVTKQIFSAFNFKDRTGEYTQYAKAMSKNMAFTWLNQRENSQANAAARDFKEYQQGSKSVFEMLGSVAQDSPDLFLNYFPQFKTFIPPSIVHHIFQYNLQKTDRGGLFGLSSKSYSISEEYDLAYQTLLESKSQIQQGFVEYFLLEPTKKYLQAFRASHDTENLQKYGFPILAQKNLGIMPHQNPVRRIDISDIAILSMFPPYFQTIQDDFDIKPFLRSLSMTPSSMGYSVIADEMIRGDHGGRLAKKEPAITFNGVDYLDPLSLAYNKAIASWSITEERIMEYDKKNDIESLLKNNTANKIITEWGIMPFGADPESLSTATGSDLSYYGALSYRNIRNFWGAVSLAETMQNDQYFKDFDVKSEIYPYMGDTESLSNRHRDLQWKSAGLKLNMKAFENVASFYGIQPGKLKLSPPVQGELTKIIN